MINQVTTNPDQLNDRATAIQIAQALDEANNLAVAEYTAAGAIVGFGRAFLKAGGTSAIAMTLAAPVAGAIIPGGKVFLKTGTAGAFTLPQPIPGSQLNGGNDGMVCKIIALDAEAYVITTPANGINGNKDTATWSAAVGNNMTLEAFNGVWLATGLVGVALTEV
jgi:hypothetical protein